MPLPQLRPCEAWRELTWYFAGGRDFTYSRDNHYSSMEMCLTRGALRIILSGVWNYAGNSTRPRLPHTNRHPLRHNNISGLYIYNEAWDLCPIVCVGCVIRSGVRTAFMELCVSFSKRVYDASVSRKIVCSDNHSWGLLASVRGCTICVFTLVESSKLHFLQMLLLGASWSTPERLTFERISRVNSYNKKLLS